MLKKYEHGDSDIDLETLEQNKYEIIKVLSNFGIDISSIKVINSPRFFLYVITLAPGINIKQIYGLEDDIALSLCVK